MCECMERLVHEYVPFTLIPLPLIGPVGSLSGPSVGTGVEGGVEIGV
jgi:hypothetical protein